MEFAGNLPSSGFLREDQRKSAVWPHKVVGGVGRPWQAYMADHCVLQELGLEKPYLYVSQGLGSEPPFHRSLPSEQTLSSRRASPGPSQDRAKQSASWRREICKRHVFVFKEGKKDEFAAEKQYIDNQNIQCKNYINIQIIFSMKMFFYQTYE